MVVEEGGDVAGGDAAAALAGEGGRGVGDPQPGAEDGQVGEGEVAGAGHGEPAFPAALAVPLAQPGGVLGPRGVAVLGAEQQEGAAGARAGHGGEEGAVQVGGGPDTAVRAGGHGCRVAAEGVAGGADAAGVDERGVVAGPRAGGVRGAARQFVDDEGDVGGPVAGRAGEHLLLPGVVRRLFHPVTGRAGEGAGAGAGAAGEVGAERLVGVVEEGDDVAVRGEFLGEDAEGGPVQGEAR